MSVSACTQEAGWKASQAEGHVVVVVVVKCMHADGSKEGGVYRAHAGQDRRQVSWRGIVDEDETRGVALPRCPGLDRPDVGNKRVARVGAS